MAAQPVLIAVFLIALVILLLGMLVGNLLKERPPKPDSFLTQEMKRIDQKGSKQ